jgi:phospholipid transport system substrate-binding protein
VPLDLEMASRNVADPAAQKIENFGAETMALLSDSSLSRGDRERRFREMLARDLDVQLLARFMLGRHWNTTDPETREAYVNAFSHYIVQRYASLLSGTEKVERFEIIRTRPMAKRDMLVETRIDRTGNKPVLAGWRLRDRGGRMLIIDVMVEGFSMAQTQRHEFKSILRAHGGRIESLIALLREQAA